MALGNLTLLNQTLFDTNDNGRYIAPSTSVVGESKVLQVSKPRQTTRVRPNATVTPAQGCTFNYTSNTLNVASSQFDHLRVHIAFEADSAVESSELVTFLHSFADLITVELVNKVRNNIR